MNKKSFLRFVLMLFTANVFCQLAFNSPEELISYGLTNSRTINLNRSFSQLQMKEAKYSISSFLPSLSFSWNEYDMIKKSQQDTRTKNITLSGTQLLYDRGEAKLNYTYNKYVSLNEYLSVENSIQEYALELLEKYYSYLLQTEILELKKSLLNSTLDEYEIVKFKYENGMAVKSDVLEYKIFCREIENEIISNKHSLTVLTNELLQLLEVEPNTDLTLTHNFKSEYYSRLSDNLKLLTEKYLASDLDLKQLEAQLLYQSKIIKLNKLIFLPSLSLKGEVAFNGRSYPLTQPDYSVTLLFSFDKLPWTNLSLNNNYGFEKNQFNKLSNSFSSTISPDLSYFTNIKLNKLQLSQLNNEIKKKKSQLKNYFTELIYSHDELIQQLSMQKETVSLMELKLEAVKFEAEKGLIKTSDYINEKNNLSEAKQKLFKLTSDIQLTRQKINLLTGGIDEN